MCVMRAAGRAGGLREDGRPQGTYLTTARVVSFFLR